MNSVAFSAEVGLKRLFLYLSFVALTMSGCGKIVDPSAPQSFGLPVVELQISSEFLGILNSNVFNRREVPARLKIDGSEWKVLARYSGQTSINRVKKSYDFQFLNGSYLGHHEYKLSAQIGDPTALNPLIGFQAFAQAGLMASQVSPAVLYLNGEYQGLYFLIEPIDADFFALRRRQLGSLYEAYGANARFTYDGGYDVRLGFESLGEKEEFYGDLELLMQILDEASSDELPQRIEALLDVDNYLRYLAVSVLLHNWDGYFNNFRLYRDPAIGKFQFIPWDLDHLLVRHPERSKVGGANRLSERLLEVPAYRERYKEILISLLDELLTIGILERRIDEVASQLAAAYEADPYLSAPGVVIFQHAEQVKAFMRGWYEELRAALVTLGP